MDASRRRWLLVVVAAATMGAAGTYQFVWSSLSGAVGARVAATGSELGTVFTAFVVAQTLVQLPAGGIRDRYGPTRLLVAAALLLAGGYAGTALATSLPAVAVAYGLGGLGAGIAYTVAVNTPVKWFGGNERRGLATGLVTMAYGGVSVAVIPVVRGAIEAAFVPALVGLAAVVGAVALAAAAVLTDPDPADRPAPDGDGSHRDPPDDGAGTDATDPSGGDRTQVDHSEGDASVSGRETERTGAVGWRGAARTWQFWALYAVMVIVNGVGLMLIGQSVGFATGLGLSAATATTVASVVALADGAGVLVGGGVSDRLGGERTMALALCGCGLSLSGAVLAGANGIPSAFVVLVAAAAFLRSPAFAIVPTVVARYYGEARSSETYAAVYSSKIPGGVIGGTVAGALVAALGWALTFHLGAALLVAAGLVTFGVRAGGTPSPAADD
jgi:OFA family oxalate/formate antiporter-like MFS transporter